MFNFKKKKVSEEDIIKLKDQLIVEAGQFEKLINQDEAWKLYVKKIEERIARLRDYKLNTKLIVADNETKRRVELFEYQADILEWAIRFPLTFIRNTNKKIEPKED